AALRRAARFGDAWMPYMYTPEMAASSYERINAERDTPIRPALFIFFCVHADGDTARAMVIERLSKQYAQDFSRLAGKYALAGTWRAEDRARRAGAQRRRQRRAPRAGRRVARRRPRRRHPRCRAHRGRASVLRRRQLRAPRRPHQALRRAGPGAARGPRPGDE